MERTTLTIDKIIYSTINQYGYHNSGVFPLTRRYYYVLTSKKGMKYTLTSPVYLKAGDIISGSIVKFSSYKNTPQIELNRIKKESAE